MRPIVKCFLNFKGMDVFERKLKAGLTTGVREAAEVIVADINSHWSPTIPGPRGGPPAVRTGRLKRSVRITARDGAGRFASRENAVSATIRYGAPYSGELEDGWLDRPFMGPAIERTASQLGSIIGRRVV